MMIEKRNFFDQDALDRLLIAYPSKNFNLECSINKPPIRPICMEDDDEATSIIASFQIRNAVVSADESETTNRRDNDAISPIIELARRLLGCKEDDQGDLDLISEDPLLYSISLTDADSLVRLCALHIQCTNDSRKTSFDSSKAYQLVFIGDLAKGSTKFSQCGIDSDEGGHGGLDLISEGPLFFIIFFRDRDRHSLLMIYSFLVLTKLLLDADVESIHREKDLIHPRMNEAYASRAERETANFGQYACVVCMWDFEEMVEAGEYLIRSQLVREIAVTKVLVSPKTCPGGDKPMIFRLIAESEKPLLQPNTKLFFDRFGSVQLITWRNIQKKMQKKEEAENHAFKVSKRKGYSIRLITEDEAALGESNSEEDQNDREMAAGTSSSNTFLLTNAQPLEANEAPLQNQNAARRPILLGMLNQAAGVPRNQ